MPGTITGALPALGAAFRSAPVLALAVLGCTLVRNVVPYPEGALARMPLVRVAWLPRVARRAGERLTAEHLGTGTAKETA